MTIHSKEVAGTGYRSVPVLPAATRCSGFYRRVGKRVFDIVFVIAAAPIVVSLVVVFSVLLAFQGAQPFYRQKRVGQNGKTFHLLKLRTMVKDAETVLEAHLAANPDARAEWERNQKLTNDPRIIRLGSFLRKSSLDELPQFWNVLVGEMSLVGPRPMMVKQQGMYPGHLYYAMRPGITGRWQVSERNQSSFAERAHHDSEYWKTMSFGTDLSIMFKTLFVVLRCTGC